MMKPLILLSVLAAGISGAEAQNQPQPQTRTALPTLRNPAILRRQAVQGEEPDDDEQADGSGSTTIDRRTLELYQEAQEAERRRNALPRPRFYDVECGNVTELQLDVMELRITCDRYDPYGQNYYILWLDVADLPPQDSGGNEIRHWRAERLIEAVNISRNDPNAHLTLRIGPLDMRSGSTIRDLSGYTIRYSD
ncbi:hypothetical protein [Maricaulis sp.]|uniref:hypothetical protein n=1 Tax=Maricaulis sp. TaxID=1486257 RepID=UPI003A8D8FAC